MNLYGPKELADSMRTVRKNTILIAEDIPEMLPSVLSDLVNLASLKKT